MSRCTRVKWTKRCAPVEQQCCSWYDTRKPIGQVTWPKCVYISQFNLSLSGAAGKRHTSGHSNQQIDLLLMVANSWLAVGTIPMQGKLTNGNGANKRCRTLSNLVSTSSTLAQIIALITLLR